MQVDYTASRSIQSGHTEGTDYTINISLNRYDRSYTRVGPAPLVALSGNTVTVTHNNKEAYNIVTTLHKVGDTVEPEDMREFLDSVVGGEPFYLDSVVHILDGGYTETREDDYYRYSFTAVKK